METWIKTQNRMALICVKEIWVEENVLLVPNQVSGGSFEIGRYGTKERAMEVFGRIEGFICKQAQIEHAGVNHYFGSTDPIFFMPKE